MYIAKIRLIAIILSLALSQVKSNDDDGGSFVCHDKSDCDDEDDCTIDTCEDEVCSNVQDYSICGGGVNSISMTVTKEVCPNGKICFNGSLCVKVKNKYHCDCDELNGETCAHEATEYCSPDRKLSFCTNFGSCKKKILNDESHPGCNCRPLYKGSYCQYVDNKESELYSYQNDQVIASQSTSSSIFSGNLSELQVDFLTVFSLFTFMSVIIILSFVKIRIGYNADGIEETEEKNNQAANELKHVSTDIGDNNSQCVHSKIEVKHDEEQAPEGLDANEIYDEACTLDAYILEKFSCYPSDYDSDDTTSSGFDV